MNKLISCCCLSVSAIDWMCPALEKDVDTIKTPAFAVWDNYRSMCVILQLFNERQQVRVGQGPRTRLNALGDKNDCPSRLLI